MKLDKNYIDATREDELQEELNEEIVEVSKWMNKYFFNVDSLLGKEKANEVRKHIINRLVEQL